MTICCVLSTADCGIVEVFLLANVILLCCNVLLSCAPILCVLLHTVSQVLGG